MVDSETVVCAVCSGIDIDVVSTRGKDNIELSVVLCKNCGLGYLSPRWTKVKYTDYYRKSYDEHYRPNFANGDSNTGQQIVERFTNLNISVPTNPVLLEIGSGEGVNIEAAANKFGASLRMAIEPSEKAQQILVSNGVKVISTDADSDWHLQLREKVDIVIMRHVLEHMLDPVLVLAKVKEVLSENGVAYIAVPNSLKASDLKNSWFRVVHTLYLNKYSLRNLLSKVGMKEEVLKEGDQYNMREVYLFARKSSIETTPRFSSDHYEEQKTVFSKVQRKEESILHRLVKNIKSKLGR